ncbi:MAG: ornithine carbamoyltransferase, partial [Firmicutes bacterium]|nr:ornithine carbamoyltransferase [Bacillota bacterium]
GIEYRGYDQQVVEDLAKYSGVPVFNGLTDVDHPTQALADIMTMEEHIAKPINQCKLVFCGDTRNNIAYCLMYICAKLGMHYVGFGPKELRAADEVMARCAEVAKETGAVIECTDDPEALKGADAFYTDIWASMGEEDLIPERVKLLTPFKVTKELMDKTGNPDCIFLHCLPSFHDFETKMAKEQLALGYDIREVTDDVFLSPNSKVFDEAENRLHTIKAVLVAFLA